MNRLPTAITILVTIAACASATPPSYGSEKPELVSKIDAFLKVDDYERAYKVVDAYIQQHPDKPIGRYMMARVLAADGHTDGAFTEYYRYYKLSKTISTKLLAEIMCNALKDRDDSVRSLATLALGRFGG